MFFHGVKAMGEAEKTAEKASRESTGKTIGKEEEQKTVPYSLFPLLHGRQVIYTDEARVTPGNIRKIINETMPKHESNRNDMQYLFRYESGIQPIFDRKKDIRPEINEKACANYAKEIVDFKLGYEFSSPVTLVQRAKDDYRRADPKQDDKRIARINEMLFEQDKPSKDLEMARHFKICGLGYMMAWPKQEQGDEIAPFDLLVLNPLNTYVVRTNDAYQKKILAVTYSQLNDGSKRITAYSDEWIFEGNSFTGNYRKTANLLGIIPIVEFENNKGRQGSFEPVIPLMDSLNIVNSDRVNDVAQYVQSILWLHNCKIDEDQKQELVNGGFIQTKTTADGREAKVTYVTSPLNQAETQTLVDYMYGQILEIAGVPGRDSASGGNTGAAILLSNGWQIAETHAKATELNFAKPSKELFKVIMAIVKNMPNVSDDLKGLGSSDVLIKFSRNRGYDLVSRTAALSNLVNLGIDLEKSLAVVDIFDDSQQVALDSMEMVDRLLTGKAGAQSADAQPEKPDMGDGNPVDGVAGEEDFRAQGIKS